MTYHWNFLRFSLQEVFCPRHYKHTMKSTSQLNFAETIKFAHVSLLLQLVRWAPKLASNCNIKEKLSFRKTEAYAKCFPNRFICKRLQMISYSWCSQKYTHLKLYLQVKCNVSRNKSQGWQIRWILKMNLDGPRLRRYVVLLSTDETQNLALMSYRRARYS